MSLWACVEHGITGPMACCKKASLASMTATMQADPLMGLRGPAQDILDKDTRIAQLEAALKDWRKYHAHLEDCTLSRPCPCGFDAWVEKVEALTAKETMAKPRIDQAPIARVIVYGDLPAEVLMYAPGLPVGEHDLYCEPTALETKVAREPGDFSKCGAVGHQTTGICSHCGQELQQGRPHG